MHQTCYMFRISTCLFSLGILTSRFEATRGLFWDGPRNFEPRSDDEDDTRAGTPSPNFHATPTGGRLATTRDLACPYSADLQWKRVSNLELSGPKAETLPLGHRGLNMPVSLNYLLAICSKMEQQYVGKL
ncbi:hypothetical protein AVEN_48812-1 [Araneus ventricosus]|uniref:Secreted protein n=1 Tax=Araneus ventricosus TaxID=182803 RepID=A0A4Y2AAD4_ARAVE|nr:hypothetical protein AVEN_48812-1 [Araneus ventricosus]